MSSQLHCGAPCLKHPELRAASLFDLVVANILAGPLVELAPAIAKSLTSCGCLLLSGILNEQAAQTVAAYRAHGFALLQHDRLEGWSTLTLVKAGVR